ALLRDEVGLRDRDLVLQGIARVQRIPQLEAKCPLGPGERRLAGGRERLVDNPGAGNGDGPRERGAAARRDGVLCEVEVDANREGLLSFRLPQRSALYGHREGRLPELIR